MGVQLNKLKDVYALSAESSEYMKKYAKSSYLEKYFLIKGCCGEQNRTELKYYYLVNKYLNCKDRTVSGWINRKMSGEDIPTYDDRKYHQRLEAIYRKWECEDSYEEKDVDCCDWKAIEW